MTDRKRYTPGDPILHPGTGRTDYYQDANGAVFKDTRHDAHGNKFTTVYDLDPAVRTGYGGPGGLQTDPAQRFGYTVYGGGTPSPRQGQVRAPAPAWGQGPVNSGGSDQVARINAAASGYSRQSEAGVDPFLVMVALGLMLLAAVLPVGIAYLVHRTGARRGRDVKHVTITLALFEPAWALFLWHLFAHQMWWPSALALLIPAGYAAYLRWRP